MSTLKFIATKQMLVEAERPFVVASSIDYLSATFEFSSEWQGCTNTAIFRREDGTPFSVQLDENNACTVPWEVIQCPYFTVSVFGLCGSKRITTNRVVIKVERCGYAAGETPKDPTPTVYETMIGNIEAVNTTVERINTNVEQVSADVEQIHSEMGDIGTALETILGGATQ